MRALTAEEAQCFLDANPQVAWVDLLLYDVNGIARGKRLPAAKLRNAAQPGGLLMPRSVYSMDTNSICVEETGLLWETGDPDFPCVLHAQTLCALPGTDCAQVVMTMPAAGAYDPRAILQDQIAKLHALGLTAVVAVELEFYLSAPLSEAMPALRPPPLVGGDMSRPQLYAFEELEQAKPFLEAVYALSHAMGLPTDAVLAESGPGQFEINLRHTNDAVQAALHGLLLKRAVKMAARQQGMDASFMAKPHEAWSGSGCHIHVSLIDEQGANIFAAPQADDPFSQKFYQALAGLQTHLAEGMAIWAQTANAYRRYVPRNYVPKAAHWGHNNRTVALRIPHGTGPAARIEHRVSGADANPFLVIAAILAALYDGLIHARTPSHAAQGDASLQESASALPLTWVHALDAFANSSFYREAFGAAFHANYLAIKRSECTRFNAQVSNIDHLWYSRLV
jgi:glutamine synthetase